MDATGHCTVCGQLMPCQTVVAAGGRGNLSYLSAGILFNRARAARDRTSAAATDRAWGQPDAIDALMLAAASVEGLVNEIAESVLQPTHSGTTATAVIDMANRVLAVEARQGPTVQKVEEALTALNGAAFDTRNSGFQEMKLLFRARNGLLHLKLDARELGKPDRRKGLPAVVRDLKVRRLTGLDPSEPPGAIDALLHGLSPVGRARARRGSCFCSSAPCKAIRWLSRSARRCKTWPRCSRLRRAWRRSG
jgi:hypothetical protein